MNPGRKARASEMLAALRADRFLLFKEADLVALNIPFELRRSTQDKALAARKERPFNPDHMPIKTPSANYYLDILGTARRETNYSNNYRRKHLAAAKAAVARGSSPPHLFTWHGQHIQNWVDSLQRAWDKLTDTEKLWFEDMPPVVQWAWDFPGLAPIPHRFYPTEETPERERQMHLLRWVIQDCGEGA